MFLRFAIYLLSVLLFFNYADADAGFVVQELLPRSLCHTAAMCLRSYTALLLLLHTF